MTNKTTTARESFLQMREYCKAMSDPVWKNEYTGDPEQVLWQWHKNQINQAKKETIEFIAQDMGWEDSEIFYREKLLP